MLKLSSFFKSKETSALTSFLTANCFEKSKRVYISKMMEFRPSEPVSAIVSEAVAAFNQCVQSIDPSVLYNNQPISLEDTFNQYFEGRVSFLCVKKKNEIKQGNMDRLKKGLIFNI